MREIKFRGLRKEYNKDHHDSKFVYGNLLNECSIGDVGIGLSSYSYAEVPNTVKILNTSKQNTICELAFGKQYNMPLFYCSDANPKRLIGGITINNDLALVNFQNPYLEIFIIEDGIWDWEFYQCSFAVYDSNLEELLNVYRSLVYLDEEVDHEA